MTTDGLQTLAGFAAFTFCFFAPGYVAGWLSNVMGFRGRSVPERALWGVVLSGPLSTLLICMVGRVLPEGAIRAILLALGLVALAMVSVDIRRARAQGRRDFDRQFWIVCLCMVVAVVYCLAATVGIQTAHSLYENVAAGDWSIRVPLVEAAARGGLPPDNPLFAIAGQSPPMRYYYYWYEECGTLMRLTHISARNAFIASTLWSWYSLIAVMFLVLKYLGDVKSRAPLFRDGEEAATSPRPEPVSLRRTCVVALGLTLVMGLDLIPTLAGFLFHRIRLMPEMESWRPDRMPSWTGAMLVAPHHVGGLAFGATGFLLLAVLPERTVQRVVHVLLAAVCFAALAGTSTYLALCFAAAGLLLAAVRVREQQWMAVALLVLCAVTAVLLSRTFLHELTSTSGYAAVAHTAEHSRLGNQYVKVAVHNWKFAYIVTAFYARMWGLPFLHNPLRYIFPLMLMVVLYGLELSFYTFVIWYRVQADLRGRQRMTEPAKMMWCLFLGIALPGIFLSSEPTQQINDLGRHAGLAIRLALIVWAAPLFANGWRELRAGGRLSPGGRWVARLTAAAVVIGLGGQMWQIAMGRIYIPLVAHGWVKTRLFDESSPFLEIRNASNAIAAETDWNAIVQPNPESAYEPIFLLYTSRRMAAGDVGCDTAFGGDIDRCRAEVMARLHTLFGGRGDAWAKAHEAPLDPARMSAADFRATCAQMHLAELVASSKDPAWLLPGTWVWTETPVYAGSSVRVFACPK